MYISLSLLTQPLVVICSRGRGLRARVLGFQVILILYSSPPPDATVVLWHAKAISITVTTSAPHPSTRNPSKRRSPCDL